MVDDWRLCDLTGRVTCPARVSGRESKLYSAKISNSPKHRLLIHVGGFNLGLVMRHLWGSGTPRGLQDRAGNCHRRACGAPARSPTLAGRDFRITIRASRVPDARFGGVRFCVPDRTRAVRAGTDSPPRGSFGSGSRAPQGGVNRPRRSAKSGRISLSTDSYCFGRHSSN